MKLLSTVAGLAALATISFSQDAKASDINPWQHCGLGAMVFDDNTTAAAISNVIWDSGTTAISSATISPDTCNSKEINVATFIDTTYDVLAMETAIGAGEHVIAALELAGCTASSNHIDSLREGLRENISRPEYAAASHADKAYNYYQTLQQTAVLCG